MQSITSDLKGYLNSPDSIYVAPENIEGNSLDSVYVVATAAKMTLNQYVETKPYEALLIAERNVAEWNDLLTSAITTGFVTSAYGKTRLNKNITDLFKLRLAQANTELETVKRLTETKGASRSERLINSIYNRALHNGDTKAATYLIDRVDGRIGDTSASGATWDHKANIYFILQSLFDKQLQVMHSGPGAKICCCSRRSGKTHLAVSSVLISCLENPRTKNIYIGETQKTAESLFGQAANQIIDKCGLKDKKGERLNWKRLDNGSEIMIRGLSNTKDPDIIRGFKANRIVIDEFFHLRSGLLEYLQSEVLEPMQMDYAGTYQQIMIGTPPKLRKTYGEMVWRTHNIPKYEWTFRDNPYIKNGEEYILKICKEKGIDRMHPFIQREYDGKWIYESDFLLYPEYMSYDASESIPSFNITQIDIGIDYGVSDHTALVGVAWDTTSNRGYVFFEKKFNLLTTPGGVGMLQYLKTIVRECWMTALQFFPGMNPVEANKRIRWSADSTDQMLTQEINRGVRLPGYPQIGINITDAHRQDSHIMEDKIRDLLRTGCLLLPIGGETALECELTVFSRDEAGNPTRTIDHKVFHPDILAALRYAMWGLIRFVDVTTHSVDLPENVVMYGGSLQSVFEELTEPYYEDEN